ncbi:ribonuclease E inhibitor RraB [Aeromonas salmonicida]|uniref:ribonuclease E inhibitor RraB n=1 Tax=Aeromonas salmonicida TaxID=645 RepID=UPI00259F024C|nr:ribonuclease E inhibitor RraB [Aeromonas salmonicida]MDM5063083.1 ribonuclease E inhibitor RraB [Aeromonas salmonicida]
MRKLLISVIAALGFSGSQADEFIPNMEINKKIIQALIDAGSDPNKPHPLEHHFNCYSPDSLKDLIAKGESLGYRAANIGDNVHEGTHYWYGDLIKEAALDIKTINDETSLMLKLANKFSADYDGWGTPVVE